MRVVVIEDEPIARQWVVDALRRCTPEVVIEASLDSVESTVTWFSTHAAPDLVISDIKLSDGNVFAALERQPLNCPIIFLTAYDQFLLRAFEDDGIAYLLKPVEFGKFASAIDKYRRLRGTFSVVPAATLQQLRRALSAPEYRQRLLIKCDDGIRLLATRDIAYIRTRGDITSAYDNRGEAFTLRETLKALETLLDPASFQRINRSEIVNIAAIERLESVGGERMLVRLSGFPVALISSAGRTPALRRWLAR